MRFDFGPIITIALQQVGNYIINRATPPRIPSITELYHQALDDVNSRLPTPEVMVEVINPNQQENNPILQTENPRLLPPVKSDEKAVACIPCTMNHFSTCSGLLNESMRFARKDGLASEETIQRISMCMDELNALERVDLRPEQIQQLQPWERQLAEQSLDLSRSLRHTLDNLSSVAELESAAAGVQQARNSLSKEWFQHRLSQLPQESQERIRDAINSNREGKITQEQAVAQIEEEL